MKAIIRVTVKTGNDTCDHCGQGIKILNVVKYIDGTIKSFGSSCIFRILGQNPSLVSFYKSKQRELIKLKTNLEILSRAPADMPRGREYFNAGFYFIGNGKGKDIFYRNQWVWHPVIDWEKNQLSKHYRQESKEQWEADANESIQKAREWIEGAIFRAESFLAKYLEKYSEQLLNSTKNN